jgi:hypothetical protein
MNKRISKLAEDAGMPTTLTYGQEQIFTRFAELLVRECGEALNYNYPPDDLLPINEVMCCLKEHFGVEE